MYKRQALGHEREARAFSDIAVLCRTHRQLELVEKCLRHDDIPCVVSGREDYLEDSGVRGMLAFLHMLQVPADGAALETALRLLWDCPADLVEKVRPTCQMQTVFDPELFREIVRGYGAVSYTHLAFALLDTVLNVPLEHIPDLAALTDFTLWWLAHGEAPQQAASLRLLRRLLPAFPADSKLRGQVAGAVEHMECHGSTLLLFLQAQLGYRLNLETCLLYTSRCV